MEDLASPGRTVVDPAFLQELDQSFQLTKFRDQFGSYLESHGLDSGAATDKKRWVAFLTYYSRVIEDAPLISEVKGLKWVDSVAVRVFDERPAGAGDYTLAIRWTWVSKKDGMQKNVVRFF